MVSGLNDAVARGVITELEGKIVDVIMAHTGCPQEVAIAAMDGITQLPEIAAAMELTELGLADD